MTTIRRNWTKRVAEIRTAVRTCHAYDSDSSNMVPVDPAAAFEAWESKPRARLTEDAPGQKWTVHVHSNRFYVLTAEEPATPADDEPAAEVPAAPTAAPGTRHAHQAAGPTSTHDRSAARTLARHARASGVPDGNRLPGHLPALAVDLVGKTVRVKLAQGYSHEQIRDEFEQERAEAQAAGDAGRVAALGTALEVHAAMVAEQDAAPSPTGPAPADHGPSSPEEQPARHRPGSPRELPVYDETYPKVLAANDKARQHAEARAAMADRLVSLVPGAEATRSEPSPIVEYQKRGTIERVTAQVLGDGLNIVTFRYVDDEATKAVMKAYGEAIRHTAPAPDGRSHDADEAAR
ncbi:hypothetical protein OG819_58340 [Streptomyces sp. NBC_01549]|uniref:hypothetical protein n=1 Tax=Streptomyces sp. NBC_01549 TaxID=2975874 RepID=UPI0022562088|nr:hypothetical protein [Streptomyces sp. NBC_01549]MCX4598853.1 hypothetical protein [Streptomyces sp. NBC_01549]